MRVAGMRSQRCHMFVREQLEINAEVTRIMPSGISADFRIRDVEVKIATKRIFFLAVGSNVY